MAGVPFSSWIIGEKVLQLHKVKATGIFILELISKLSRNLLLTIWYMERRVASGRWFIEFYCI